MNEGRRAFLAAAVLAALGLVATVLSCSVVAPSSSGPGTSASVPTGIGIATAAASPRSPDSSTPTGASPSPDPSGSLPNLSVENGTTLTVALYVNGQRVGDFPPHSWTWTVAGAALPPLPWLVEARSSSGRALVSLDVRHGDIQTTVGASGDVALKFDGGKVDLSCGRVRVLAGWDSSAPPPYGALPTPTGSPAGPTPSAASTPDDCTP